MRRSGTYQSSASWSTVLQKKQPEMSPLIGHVGVGQTAMVWPNLPQLGFPQTGPWLWSGAVILMARPSIALKCSWFAALLVMSGLLLSSRQISSL